MPTTTTRNEGPVEVNGRQLSHADRDCVKLAGRGGKLFRFRSLATNGDRVWVEVYGPIANDGEPMPHAKHQAVAVTAVTAKVRAPVPNGQRLRREGLAPRPRARRVS